MLYFVTFSYYGRPNMHLIGVNCEKSPCNVCANYYLPFIKFSLVLQAFLRRPNTLCHHLNWMCCCLHALSVVRRRSTREAPFKVPLLSLTLFVITVAVNAHGLLLPRLVPHLPSTISLVGQFCSRALVLSSVWGCLVQQEFCHLLMAAT